MFVAPGCTNSLSVPSNIDAFCFICLVARATERTQGMSISIGAGYDLPEEKHRVKIREEEGGGGGQESDRIAVVDDLNDKLQASDFICFLHSRG